ncbi:MAG: hypothetical protein DME26_17275 [Verrucomicrobia bacterium]|nr:MAG: hypothetical protein DME26_17275 [Verrucomicrobiota bacterium]
MNGAQELEGRMTHMLKLPTNAPVTERASWFYASAGETFGPFTEAALEALVRNGNVPSDILVRSEAAPHWKPYRETQFALPVERQGAPQLTSGISTTVEARVDKKSARYETIHEAVCRECRGIFMTDAMLQHGDIRVCSGCMQSYIDRMGLVKLIYAGCGVRVIAKLLDALIIGVCFMLPVALWAFYRARLGDASWFVILPVFLAIAYPLVYPAYAIFFVGRYGATPGKMVCKIRITDPKGCKIDYGTATKRYFAEVLGTMLWMLGYLLAVFDQEKRTLHDRICKTRVVSKITKPGPDELRFPAEA